LLVWAERHGAHLLMESGLRTPYLAHLFLNCHTNGLVCANFKKCSAIKPTLLILTKAGGDQSKEISRQKQCKN
jgi:hypothetical protein